MSFTHVEFLPVMEHPFYGSWGYQATGYFAPTSRYGTPQDFMYLVDTLHQHGIGVILDWVPSHFPTDEHGLGFFDGTHLYEHADPRQGIHPDWDSYIFNYGRNEVRSFLLSSALFWLDRYHVDGLRVDAVASMLYLDYSRQGRASGSPTRTADGRTSRRSTSCAASTRRSTERYPDVMTIAEESTAWPMVSRPDLRRRAGLRHQVGHGVDARHAGRTCRKDPIHRKYHHNELTFRMIYAFTENFVLPLSHDEVVHGKGSLLGKMPGDDWQKFANLRAPVRVHVRAAGEEAALHGRGVRPVAGVEPRRRAWTGTSLRGPPPRRPPRWVEDLNRLYRDEPALHEFDFDPAGFEWVDARDAEQSVISLFRKARGRDDLLLAVFNFTPVPRHNYRVGVPRGGFWHECLNSDATEYGGSGQGNIGGVEAAPIGAQGRFHSLNLVVPPLSALFLKSGGQPGMTGDRSHPLGATPLPGRALPLPRVRAVRADRGGRSCSLRRSGQCRWMRTARDTITGSWTGWRRGPRTCTDWTARKSAPIRPRATSRRACTAPPRSSTRGRSRGGTGNGAVSPSRPTSSTSCTSGRSRPRAPSTPSSRAWTPSPRSGSPPSS